MNIEKVTDILTWWEKKRVWYNIIVLLFGVWQIVIEKPDTFGFDDVKCIIIYGLGANLFYSSGTLLELLDEYYFKSFLKLNRLRWVFLIAGTIFSVLYTMIMIQVYYNGPIWSW